MKNKQIPKFVFLFAMLIIVATGTGCGRKAWPTPMEEQDSFFFSNISGETKGKCLEVRGNINGNISNLRQLILEIEFRDKQTCPTCPFIPQRNITFLPDNPHLYIKGHSFVLTYCGEKEKQVERFKLLGFNKFNTIRPVSSPIIKIKALSKKNKEKN